MKKWTVLLMTGLFLFGFGCDSDEESGCTADTDCAEGQVCDLGTAVAAEEDGLGDVAEDAAGDAANDAAADAASDAAGDLGGDAASAVGGSILGGDDAASGGTCIDAPVVEEEEEEVVVVEASAVFTSEDENVGTACGDAGFCMDFAADAGVCEAAGGTEVSGLCNGPADIKCCEKAACSYSDADGNDVAGSCVGTEEDAKAGAVGCDMGMQSACPSTAATGGAVMCCGDM